MGNQKVNQNNQCNLLSHVQVDVVQPVCLFPESRIWRFAYHCLPDLWKKASQGAALASSGPSGEGKGIHDKTSSFGFPSFSSQGKKDTIGRRLGNAPKWVFQLCLPWKRTQTPVLCKKSGYTFVLCHCVSVVYACAYWRPQLDCRQQRGRAYLRPSTTQDTLMVTLVTMEIQKQVDLTVTIGIRISVLNCKLSWAWFCDHFYDSH